jgi:hypothetical protein
MGYGDKKYFTRVRLMPECYAIFQKKNPFKLLFYFPA